MKIDPHGEVLRDALIAVGFVVLFLTGLGRPELMDPDESRIAEIARSMLVNEQFVTPRLCGEPYYDKPVGFHWTVAAALALFGRTATAAARLPSALAALAALATTAWWARRISNATAARLAAVMLGTSYLFVALGRFVSIDMFFSAILTAAVARLSVAAAEPADVRRSALGSYALVAIATLVKGPVALVLLVPSLVAAWFTTREQNTAWLVPWRGFAIILAIAMPWYAAAAYADPLYIRTFLATHNLARFAGTESLGHQNPLAYYVMTLPLALLPWTPLIAFGSYSRLRHRRLPPSEVVLITWIATVLGVFGFAGTKIITYLLPAFPALATLAAAGLADLPLSTPPTDRARWWLAIWIAVCGTTVGFAVVTASAWRIASLPVGLGSGIVTATTALALVAYAVALRRAVRRSLTPMNAIAFLAAGTVVAAGGAYGAGADLLTAARGYRSLGAELAREVPPVSVVVSLARAPHALAFYSGRTIGRISDLDAARSALAADRPVLLLTKQKYADALTAESASTNEAVWRNAQGTTLLANALASGAWRRREGVEPSADHDGRHHGFEDRSGHRTRSLSTIVDFDNHAHP